MSTDWQLYPLHAYITRLAEPGGALPRICSGPDPPLRWVGAPIASL